VSASSAAAATLTDARPGVSTNGRKPRAGPFLSLPVDPRRGRLLERGVPWRPPARVTFEDLAARQ
jgi:hypothetical protein